MRVTGLVLSLSIVSVLHAWPAVGGQDLHAAGEQPASEPATSSLDDAVAPPLTIDTAMDELLRRNPELIAIYQRQRAAETAPAVERFLPPPMAAAQIFRWPLDTLNPARVQLMVTVQQELPGKGKRALRAARAEREAEVVGGALAVRTRELVGDLKEAYVVLSRARQEGRLYERSIVLTDQITQAAEAKYAAGRISQQDIVKGLLERARLEDAMLVSQETARLASIRLNILMGRDPASPIGTLVEPAVASLPTLARAQARAREEHPEIRAAKLETVVAEADMALAAAERRPDFSIEGGYMRMPQETDAWTGRIAVTWPRAPWSRGRLDALSRQALERRDAALANEDAARSRVAQSVQEAYARVETATDRAALIERRLLPRTEHVLELARLGYQADRAEFLDVIDAARTSVDLQLEAVRAEADRQLAVIALERALGSELPDRSDPETR